MEKNRADKGEKRKDKDALSQFLKARVARSLSPNLPLDFSNAEDLRIASRNTKTQNYPSMYSRLCFEFLENISNVGLRYNSRRANSRKKI